MRESELEKLCNDYICSYSTIAAWKVKAGGQKHSFGDGRSFFKKSSMPGFPDMLIIANGKFVGVEFKAIKGRQSPVQKECQRKIENASGLYYIVRNFDQFKFIVGTLL